MPAKLPPRQPTLRETEEAIRNQAEAFYADGDLQIYPDAEIRPAEGGNWVQAWVWVPNEEDDDE